MRRRIKEYALLFITLFLLVPGCERKEKPLEITLHQENSPSVRIGVVPAITVKDTIEQYQPITDYLGVRLNIDARLMPQKDYLAVLEKMRSGAIDAGIMGSLICYRAIKELGAVPLARPEINGASTYEGVVFTRKDSGIRDIHGLRGRSFAFVDRDTSAGYVYPNFLLKKSGYDPGSFFMETIFAGKHDAAVLMVLDRRADGGAAKDDVYFRLEKENPRIKKELTVLHASSARFPDRTFVVRNGLDATLAGKLKEALLGMDKDEEGRRTLKAAGFDRYVPTGREDFSGLEKMLE